MNPKCGWCTKADPVVAELVEKGYKITTLDITNQDDAKKAAAVQEKHNTQCGTPLFLDANSGNMVCGFRPDVLEDWAKGEEIPAPPPRQMPPQQQPQGPGPQQQPQGPQLIKFEYIWLDGNASKNIRSKIRFVKLDRSKINSPLDLINHIPDWSFDGSSTNQADGDESDCIIKPVKVVPNTTERARTPSFIVLCEVYDHEENPHKTNSRATLKNTLKETNQDDMWFGVEQEYTMVNKDTYKPIGWPGDNVMPRPQGEYYCGVGADSVQGREIAESHAMACNGSGVPVSGINAEVMLSQWEYQIEPMSALEAADNVWISRFILQRLAEMTNVAISYHPKPVEGDWNGSGAHINFSTKFMREHADMSYMNFVCVNMEKYHDEAISCYGVDNDKRLTGKYETSSIDKFTWGEMDRNASIRIPVHTVNNDGKGYLEDRRPAANVDPYEAFNHLINVSVSINEELLITT